jgi:hypothetical protein
LISSLAYGQGVATGDLHVTVKDPQARPVINGTVTARATGKGFERLATGDGQGEYSIVALPPGSYGVIVSAPGFADSTAFEVVITVGDRSSCR